MSDPDEIPQNMPTKSRLFYHNLHGTSDGRPGTSVQSSLAAASRLVGRRHCQAGAMSTVQSITPLAAASAASLAAPHVSWDEALAPDALDLVVLFRGQSLRRKPHASAKLKGDELAAAQAAWNAADDTSRRNKIREMRRTDNKRRAARPPTAEDSDRRVEQRRNDAGQQQAHRGARPPMIRVPCPLPISF